ncbi:hypothetical protein M427DRAFT_68647 [Gonapodya prolifera JEL478]|uniref:DDHD domain-containing protein n=1 Tax=Gonapodya prolifera (strain JEL478) TaxID=1344416 RepID=A0A139AKE8_GONPJ|nr:hypothetical protein M427DRAFT_68647 [Gonapodya prolifera JEL478]|eukprot:KXS17246.1 hypothetical protein M427DRAFT_68647 [Gonapodya prolifera JEL478]
MASPEHRHRHDKVDVLCLLVTGIGPQNNLPRNLSSLRSHIARSVALEHDEHGVAPLTVEIREIDWHTSLHRLEDVDRQLNLVSNQNIPLFRKISNDVLLDVVMFFTPHLGSWMLQFVRDQLNDLYRSFCATQPGGVFDGVVVLMGYSLGGVISFDLLQKQTWKAEEAANSATTLCADESIHSDTGVEQTRLPPAPDPPTPTTSPKPLSLSLAFRPRLLVTLGSPIAAVQVARTEHGAFAQKLDHVAGLGVRFLNLFSTNDPMGYRCEPLLSPSFKQVPPVTIPHVSTSRSLTARAPSSTPAPAPTPTSVRLTLGLKLSATIPLPLPSPVASLALPSLHRTVQTALDAVAVSTSASVRYLGGVGGVVGRWRSRPQGSPGEGEKVGKRARDRDDVGEGNGHGVKRQKGPSSPLPHGLDRQTQPGILASIASSLLNLTGRFTRTSPAPAVSEPVSQPQPAAGKDGEMDSGAAAAGRDSVDGEDDESMSDRTSDSASSDRERTRSPSPVENTFPPVPAPAPKTTPTPPPLVSRSASSIIPPHPRLDFVVTPDFLFTSFTSPRPHLGPAPGYLSAARDYLAGLRAHFSYWHSARVAGFLVGEFRKEVGRL